MSHAGAARLLPVLQAEVKRRWGSQADVKIDGERGVWVSGIEGEAHAATTIFKLAKRLGVSRRPMSEKDACKMLGLQGDPHATLIHYARRRGIPYHVLGGRLGSVFYQHEVERWIKENNHDAAKLAAKSANISRGMLKGRDRKPRVHHKAAPSTNGITETTEVWARGPAIDRLKRMAKKYAKPPLLTEEAVRAWIIEQGLKALVSVRETP